MCVGLQCSTVQYALLMTVDFVLFLIKLCQPNNKSVGHVHIMSEKYENAALFLRLGVPSDPSRKWTWDWWYMNRACPHDFSVYLFLCFYEQSFTKMTLMWFPARVSDWSSGGARGAVLPPPPPPLFWIKKEEMTEGRQASWAGKSKPPHPPPPTPYNSSSGSPTATFLDHWMSRFQSFSGVVWTRLWILSANFIPCHRKYSH